MIYKKLKKFLSVLLIALLQYSAQGQVSLIFADEFHDSAAHVIGITGDYSLNANSLTNTFLTKFYKGGYIDTDLKNSVLTRMENKNRIGAELNYGIYGAFKLHSNSDDSIHLNKNDSLHLSSKTFLPKNSSSLFFSIRNRAHFDARFSKDLFKVVFYGNSVYAGKTADFNDFNLTLLRYQQFQLGFFSSKLDSAARWGIGVSFLKGQQYSSVLAKKAELYTSEDGQYLDFNTSLQVGQSDTSRKGLGAFNGYGASIDIYFEAPYKTRFGDSKLSIEVNDIGIIRFNKQSLYLNQDSLFHYSGFKINSIFDIQDSTFGNSSRDSVINSIAPFKKQSISVTIPATLNIAFKTRFSKHFGLTEGVRYIFNANYSLFAYLKGDIYFNKNFILSTSFGYGGYGNFNYGLGISAKLGKGFKFYAGSNNIEGFLIPKESCGQGAYISLIKEF